MPNFAREPIDDHLDVVARVMDTVQKQIESYRASLTKVRALRREIESDSNLRKRVVSGPEEMSKLLVERGIPRHLASAMAAEDYQDRSFDEELALWTWDCCCTECCLTCYHCRHTTSAA